LEDLFVSNQYFHLRSTMHHSSLNGNAVASWQTGFFEVLLLHHWHFGGNGISVIQNYHGYK